MVAFVFYTFYVMLYSTECTEDIIVKRPEVNSQVVHPGLLYLESHSHAHSTNSNSCSPKGVKKDSM